MKDKEMIRALLGLASECNVKKRSSKVTEGVLLSAAKLAQLHYKHKGAKLKAANLRHGTELLLKRAKRDKDLAILIHFLLEN